MKVCTNCYTENAPDEVFCSNCGMSLRAAPTGEEALKLLEKATKLEEDKQRRREQPLTASGIVYLFGHQFARPWDRSAKLSAGANIGGKVALAGLAGLPGFLAGPSDTSWAPVRVPLSDQQVRVGDLGFRLWEAAFVSLAQDGYIDLQIERREGTFLSKHGVAIGQVKAGDDLPRSLERSIMEALAHPPKTRWLKDVVMRLTKQRGKWSSVVDIEKEALVEMGWLQRGVVDKEFVHGTLTEEAAPLLDAIAGEVETVKTRLTTFATGNPDLHDRLAHDVKDGVNERSGRPFSQW
jgi:hypothetical protein